MSANDDTPPQPDTTPAPTPDAARAPRRAVLAAFGAALGATGLTAAPARTATPAPAPSGTLPLPVGAANDPAATSAASRAATLGALEAFDVDPDGTALVGVSWAGAVGRIAAVPATYRARSGGVWGPWLELAAVDDEAAVPGSAEARRERAVAGPEILTGVDRVEVRLGEAALPEARITVVTSAVTPVDRQIASLAGRAAEGSGATTNAAEPAAAPAYVTRRQWGADESLVRCASDYTSSIRGIVTHHTAGSNTYTRAQAPGVVRGILAFHTQGNGWCDIGYNVLIDKFGTAYEGRRDSLTKLPAGAHTNGFNAQTFGVSVMGTYTSANISAAAQATLIKVYADVATRNRLDPTGRTTYTSSTNNPKFDSGERVTLPVIVGHRDLGSTTCPGGAFYAWLPTLRTEVRKAMGSAPAATPYPVRGAIGAYYRANAATTGLPTGPEIALSGGAFQNFRNGKVHWSPATGARFTKANSGIQLYWAGQGWERGWLGYPTGDERTGLRRGGAEQTFQGGAVLWSPATSTRAIKAGIGAHWRRAGGVDGAFGYPRTNEYASSLGGIRQDFEGGSIRWTAARGAWTL